MRTAHVCKDGGGVAEKVVRADELVHLEGGLVRVCLDDAVGDVLAGLEDVLHQHPIERQVHILQREHVPQHARHAVQPLCE